MSTKKAQVLIKLTDVELLEYHKRPLTKKSKQSSDREKLRSTQPDENLSKTNEESSNILEPSLNIIDCGDSDENKQDRHQVKANEDYSGDPLVNISSVRKVVDKVGDVVLDDKRHGFGNDQIHADLRERSAITDIKHSPSESKESTGSETNDQNLNNQIDEFNSVVDADGSIPTESNSRNGSEQFSHCAVKFGFLTYFTAGGFEILHKLGEWSQLYGSEEVTRLALGTSSDKPYETFVVTTGITLYKTVHLEGECGQLETGCVVDLVCLVGTRACLLNGTWFEFLSNYGEFRIRKNTEKKSMYKAGSGTTET